MNKIEKMAAKDAHEYGVSQMFFGEGAGTRRKLIDAVIEERINTVPGYEVALDKAYGELSQIEMAEKAIAERKRIDRVRSTSKNFRALRSGNISGLTNAAFAGVAVYYIARSTGADKVVIAKAKDLKKKVQAEFNKHRGTTVINLFQQNEGTA